MLISISILFVQFCQKEKRRRLAGWTGMAKAKPGDWIVPIKDMIYFHFNHPLIFFEVNYAILTIKFPNVI